MRKVTRIDPAPQPPHFEKVGIYCRVSSPTSAQLHSLAAQASHLLQYALHHRTWVVEDIYIEVASGSSAAKRPEFMRMLSDISSGKITQVVTKSVSRFGRNTEEILVSFRAITSLGAHIFFEEQDLSSRFPDCELYLSLYGGIAQEENHQLSENIKWGIKKRAQDGTSTIYNRPCYGYRVNEAGEFEIVPDEASIVREIFSMYLRGLSILKIKQQLEGRGVPSPTGKPAWSKHTIDTILDNKKYIGTSVIYKSYHTGHPESKRVINRGTHDMYELSNHHVPIIPVGLFEQVQNARAERTNMVLDTEGKPKRKGNKYSAAKIKTWYNGIAGSEETEKGSES